MNEQPDALRPYPMHAIVVPLRQHFDGCQEIQLFHDRGELTAWTWAPIPKAPPAAHLKAVAHTILVQDTSELFDVVTRFNWSPNMDACTLVPETFGLTKDVVHRFRHVTARISCPDLRMFVSDVFSTPAVFRDYWAVPGLNQRAPGSMAELAVREAARVCRLTGISARTRDLALVYSLLRDIGLVWTHNANAWKGPATSDVKVAMDRLDGPFSGLAEVKPLVVEPLRQLMLAGREPVTHLHARAVQGVMQRLPTYVDPLDQQKGI